jgi:hypothetical protein
VAKGVDMRERTNEVEVERDVKVTVSDGTVLLADVYHPVGVDDTPTLLERTPYGRANFASAMGPEFAARGYRYVLQACRGTDGSGGTHSYFAEAGDGRATADWIASQPWFNGRMGSFGASYMGFTQWALASTEPPYLKAMAVALSTSVRAYSWYPGGSLALEVIIPWDAGATQFNKQADAIPTTDISPEGIEQRMAELKAGFDHLPLGEVIQRLTGVDLPLYRDQLAHGGAGDPFWDPVNFRPPTGGMDGADPARRRLARLPAAGRGRGLRRPARLARPRASAHRRRRTLGRGRGGRHDRRTIGVVRHLVARPGGTSRPHLGKGPRARRRRALARPAGLAPSLRADALVPPCRGPPRDHAAGGSVGARPLSLRPCRPDAVVGRHRHAYRGHR